MRPFGPLATHERTGLAGSLIVLAVAVAMIQPPAADPSPPAATSNAAPTPVAPLAVGSASEAGQRHGTVGVAETLQKVVLFAAPDRSARSLGTITSGILLPIIGHRPGYLHVQTPCDVQAWVEAQQVRVHPPGPAGDVRTMAAATIVIDPGHGGSAPGAIGPNGKTEKDVNLAIASRLAERLSSSRTLPDQTNAQAARVFLTRSGDTDASLKYRTLIGNSLNAQLLLSVHNNAEPDGPSDHPGSETYHQIKSAESKRMAGLAWEELFRSLDSLGGKWASDRDAGAKIRTNSKGGDYYAVLRTSKVPSVLAEILYISDPREERLLASPTGQKMIAGALDRAVVRFITTTDPGSGFVDPYPREAPGGPSGSPRCSDPA